jgi:outer membrane protein assembly factor BamD
MKKVLYLICVVVLLSSCASTNKHNRLLKSNDQDAKFEAAMKAYEKGDYMHANQLFENLLLYSRGREMSEKVNLYYAKSLLGSKDYYSAGYQFESFVKWYPYSKYAEEALFQAAYCKYLEAPDYTLDQTLTKQSMDAFQEYIEKYPNSERVAEANKLMDELRENLIEKDYQNAFNYYKTMQYHAACVSFKRFLNDYPDVSQKRENAMYYIVLAGYKYANNSVEDKLKERFEEVILDYERYSVVFANMKDEKKRKELENIYNESKIKYNGL